MVNGRETEKIMTRFAPILLFALLLSGCAAKTMEVVVERTADALLLVAKGVGTSQTLVIEANRQGLMDDQLTKEVLEVCRDINLAGKEAVRAAQRILQLSPGERAQVLNTLIPVINALDAALLKVNLIKDQQTRTLVHTALSGLQATLSSVQLSLITGGTSGNPANP